MQTRHLNLRGDAVHGKAVHLWTRWKQGAPQKSEGTWLSPPENIFATKAWAGVQDGNAVFSKAWRACLKQSVAWEAKKPNMDPTRRTTVRSG